MGTLELIDRPTTKRDRWHRQIDLVDKGHVIRCIMFPAHSHQGGDHLVLWLPGCPWGRFPAPPWLIEAWHDNAPVGPLIDYLIENSEPAHAAVLQEVAALLVRAGEGR